MGQSCESFYTLLNEYIDGTINSVDGERLDQHIKDCRGCSQELESLKSTINTIKTLKNIEIPQAKETFASEIILKIQEEEKKQNIFFFPKFKVAAASLIIVSLAVFFSFHIISNYHKPQLSNNNKVIEEYADDFNNILYDSDSSIIAEAGMPTDNLGLIGIDGN